MHIAVQRVPEDNGIHVRFSEQEEGRTAGPGEEMRTMAALCSRAGILLTSLLTRLAGDRVVCARRWLFASKATRIVSPATKSGKASHRAFLDHFVREVHGLRVGMPRVKVDGDSPRRETCLRTCFCTAIVCTPDLGVPHLLSYCTPTALSRNPMRVFVGFHCRNNYLM